MKMTPALQKIFDHREQLNPNRKVITAPDNSCQVYLYEKNGGHCSVAYKGRAKKPAWRYRFGTVELRSIHLNDWMDKCIKDAKTPATIPRELKVGDVLVSSWGYDQTNINYYLVTKLVGETQVTIAEIGKQKIYSGKTMSGQCVPDVAGGLIGKPMTKRVYDGHKVKIESYAWAHLKPVGHRAQGIDLYDPDNYTTYA